MTDDRLKLRFRKFPHGLILREKKFMKGKKKEESPKPSKTEPRVNQLRPFCDISGYSGVSYSKSSGNENILPVVTEVFLAGVYMWSVPTLDVHVITGGTADTPHVHRWLGHLLYRVPQCKLSARFPLLQQAGQCHTISPIRLITGHNNSSFISMQGELRISVLPTHLSYDAPWPIRKVALRCTPHFVVYHPESKVRHHSSTYILVKTVM